jgi:hypothetical protein
MSGEITPLVDGKLFALSNHTSSTATPRVIPWTHAATRRCSATPEAGGRALLVGTSLTIHQQVSANSSFSSPNGFSIMPLGLDFTGLCNARPIAVRFGIEHVYQSAGRRVGRLAELPA